MSRPNDKPVRGEAAWRAARESVSKRNDAARAAGAQRRAAREAEAAEEAARLRRREARGLSKDWSR